MQNHLGKRPFRKKIKAAPSFETIDTTALFWVFEKKQEVPMDLRFLRRPKMSRTFASRRERSLCRLKDVCTGWVSEKKLPKRSKIQLKIGLSPPACRENEIIVMPAC